MCVSECEGILNKNQSILSISALVVFIQFQSIQSVFGFCCCCTVANITTNDDGIEIIDRFFYFWFSVAIDWRTKDIMMGHHEDE